MIDLVEQLHGYGEQLLSELDRADAEASKGPRRLVQEPTLATGDLTNDVDAVGDSAESDVCEACGSDLTVVDLRGPAEHSAPQRPKHRTVVALAVAAAIMLVAGIVVVDGNGDDVVTEPVTSATTPEPVPSPTPPDPTPPPQEVGPPPSVVDSLGYQWSRVPDVQAGVRADGEAWIRNVVAGGPGFVAVGSLNDKTAVWTSPDGVAWSRVPHDDAIFPDGAIFSVIVGGPGLVAVGQVGFSSDTRAAVWTSPDGVTWSRVSHDEAVFGGSGDQSISGVTIGGPGLVAVGNDDNTGAAVWTSADGVTWSRVPPSDSLSGDLGPYGFEDSMIAVTAWDGGLVAVGVKVDDDGYDRPAVWTSLDGINWSVVPAEPAFSGSPWGYPRLRSVTAGGPGLVAVGWSDYQAGVWTSVDGVVWSRVPLDEAIFGGSWAGMAQVVDVGSGLIAVGTSDGQAVVWTSPAGVVWSRVPHDEALFGAPISEERLDRAGDQGWLSGMAAVAVGPSSLVAVGFAAQVNESPAEAVVWIAEPKN